MQNWRFYGDVGRKEEGAFCLDAGNVEGADPLSVIIGTSRGSRGSRRDCRGMKDATVSNKEVAV